MEEKIEYLKFLLKKYDGQNITFKISSSETNSSSTFICKNYKYKKKNEINVIYIYGKTFLEDVDKYIINQCGTIDYNEISFIDIYDSLEMIVVYMICKNDIIELVLKGKRISEDLMFIQKIAMSQNWHETHSDVITQTI